MQKKLAVAALSLFLASCATWSTSEVKPAAGTAAPAAAAAAAPAVVKTSPADILVTENDITDRKYRSLGDLSVTVNKTTIFHPDPTPELVKEKLREEAAKLGADAVVLARTGTVGISFMSWGSLDGSGRAVVFER